MDVSTRRLRYFVAVAEELNFSRAARGLFVSQQSLSKHIVELEAELGTRLFDRSTRRVELTAAGEQFLRTCTDLLQLFDAAVQSARNAAEVARERLTLGFFVFAALELTTPILKQFAHEHPRVDLTLQEFSYRDPTAGLAAGTSDLAIVRLPLALPGLHWAPLFTETRVVAVAASHPLADRRQVRVADLVGQRLTQAANDDPDFHRFWGLTDYLPQPAPEPVHTGSHAEELEVVATGRACSITAACAARYAPHREVRFLPIADVPGVTTAVAWCGELSDTARRFVQVATTVRDRETAVVHDIEHHDTPSGL